MMNSIFKWLGVGGKDLGSSYMGWNEFALGVHSCEQLRVQEEGMMRSIRCSKQLMRCLGLHETAALKRIEKEFMKLFLLSTESFRKEEEFVFNISFLVKFISEVFNVGNGLDGTFTMIK
ncbi:hypothetical protein AVEN_69142-1 [Araneus ventricosus]|uniref:Uncharacterized protein n=1 Tax=Araneus ventricosus TaxID=182803 RepID=A0A4Y2HTL5_ARAVE|nr:hypothetical protein AVEN_69142-1 [Araneus ventricosus]